MGLLVGSHLTIVSTVESGASGKGRTGSKEVDLQPYFRKVLELLKATWREGDVIVVGGPGNTKFTLENLVKKDPDLRKNEVLIEGFDLSGSDGVRAMVKSEGFRKVASDSVLVEVQGIVEEAIRRMSRGERRIAYTLPRVSEAARAGAVETCVVSDDVFTNNVDENMLVETLNIDRGEGREGLPLRLVLGDRKASVGAGGHSRLTEVRPLDDRHRYFASRGDRGDQEFGHDD